MNNFNTLTNQNIIYAHSSLSKINKMQMIFMYIEKKDNDLLHFWNSFCNVLSIWNVQFSLKVKQKGFPKTKDDTLHFLDLFQKKLLESPVILIISNIQQVKNKEIQLFLYGLLDIPPQNLFLILMYNKSSAINTEKDTFSNVSLHKYRLLSEKEEMDYYKKQSIFLSENDMDTIRYYTDGWLASIKFMAHLLLTRGVQILENMNSISLTYTEEYFLEQYDEKARHLLICLSLLKEFPMELVQKLVLMENKDVIDQLDNSIYIRYNSETKCFYFAPFLQPMLEKRQILLSNKQKESFYLWVGNWYQEHGDKISALNCYRKAYAYKKILQIIKQWAFPATSAEASCYIEAINEMPSPLLDKYPLLQIMRCYMLCTLFRYEESHILIKKFCIDNDNNSVTNINAEEVLGEAYLLWAYLSTCSNPDLSEAYPLYQRAAELLPNGSALIHYKMNLLGDAPAIRLPSSEAGSMQKCSDLLYKVEPYLIKITGGGMSGCAHLAAAEMHFYTRNFKQVENTARKAIGKALQNEQYDIVCSAYYLLMRYNMAKGNYDRLMECYELLIYYAGMAQYASYFTTPELAKAWLMLKLGIKNGVADWIIYESRYQEKIAPWNYGRNRVTQCYFLLESNKFLEVIAYAEARIELMKQRGYNILVLQLLIMKTVALYALNERTQAVEVFEEIYHLTAQNEIVMPMIEYGNYIRPILQQCKKTETCSIPRSWLDEIEKKATSYYTYQYNIRKKHEQNQKVKQPASIIGKLTRAELELLLYIGRGMSLKEIAELQGKSISAVKAMCRRMYIKIDARSKSDAVRIATEAQIEKIIRK